MVLLAFLNYVARFAHTPDGNGNKMDISNLATVIAPNILYSKGGAPSSDESFLAVQAVEMLLKHQSQLSMVSGYPIRCKCML
jgi:hypothetical protein